MFRRVCTARMDDFKDQGQTLKKDAVRFKMQVTKRKAEMMAEAEKSGKPFKEAGQFQKVQDSTRNSMMQVGRLSSAGEQFFVSKGLTQADILVGVVGSVLILILLIAFIFAGVKAFTEPNSPVAASINSGLTTTAGAGSDSSSKGGLSPDILTKFIDEIAS